MGHYLTVLLLAALGLGWCISSARADIASWYGAAFAGKPMANGCKFHPNKVTAASRKYPLGTWLRIRNLRNGRTIIVQVTDRGPYIPGRELDLSAAAAARLGFLHDGLAQVSILSERAGPPRHCLPQHQSN